MEFKEIEIGTYFMFNGNECRKNSKCTARLCNYAKVVYFEQDEIIHVVLSKVEA